MCVCKMELSKDMMKGKCPKKVNILVWTGCLGLKTEESRQINDFVPSWCSLFEAEVRTLYSKNRYVTLP